MQKLITFSKKTLSNGLTVFLAPQPTRKMTSIHFFVRCGSRFENSEHNGYAHFLEHILLKGPASIKQEGEFYQKLEGLGADLNGCTFPEFTYLTISLPKENAAKGLKLLADTIIQPRFVKKEIENEKKVITEEMNQFLTKNQEPADAWDTMVQLMWPGHPLGQNVLGKKEAVQNITTNALRKFMRTYYFAENSNLIVSGDIAHETLKAPLAQLEKLPSQNKKINPKAAPTAPNDTGKYSFIEKEELSAEAMIAFPSVSYKDANVTTQDVFSAGLTWGWGSELFKKIRRELGLIYSIWDASTHYMDTGFWGVGFQTSPENFNKIIQQITKILRNTKEQGLNSKNIKRSKELLRAEVLEDTDRIRAVNYFLGQRHLYNYYQDPAQEIAQIRAVSNENIKQFAQSYLTLDNFYVSYIGPNAEKHQRELKNTAINL